MRVCDWIAQYLKKIGVKRVYGVMGGGAAGLNDGFLANNLDYICYHHEQGAGHAAIGESKYTGKIAVVNPTTGCGGSNCATSVLDAWQDGVPLLFISGNVKLDNCSNYINSTKGLDIRKYGIQEHDITKLYSSITKYSKLVISSTEVPYEIEYAIQLATTGRPGPVWLDIPSDVQTAKLPEEMYSLPAFINRFERPLILAGYGISQANEVSNFIKFIEKYRIPYVGTYGTTDYLPFDHPLNIGIVGQRGSRAGNFALQNADLLIILGSSLNAGVIGYSPQLFAPNAYKIHIDIDKNELSKDIVKVNTKIQKPLKSFFEEYL